jgi:hypothetical protein
VTVQGREDRAGAFDVRCGDDEHGLSFGHDISRISAALDGVRTREIGHISSIALIDPGAII